MPTYEYQCDGCQHNFDDFQSINDPPLTKCPKCGKKKLRRVFGAGAAVIFRGSGFYQTDYRSESYKAGEKADKESSKPAGDGAKSTTGTDGAKESSGGDKGGEKKSKSRD